MTMDFNSLSLAIITGLLGLLGGATLAQFGVHKKVNSFEVKVAENKSEINSLREASARQAERYSELMGTMREVLNMNSQIVNQNNQLIQSLIAHNGAFNKHVKS